MSIKTKNQGIELLRIVSMLMVMTLHVLGHGGVLQASKSIGAVQMLAYYSVEVLCYPAVDIFILISGYVSSSHELNIKRIVNRWAQVFFYSFVIATVVYLLGYYEGDVYGVFIKHLLPVLYSKYWFFTAYFALMFVSPFLNITIEKLERRNLFKLFVVLIILFSFMSLLTDPFKISSGYSFVWLTILYVIGKILKQMDLLKNVKSKYIVAVIIGMFIITMIPYAVFKKGILSNYVSPTILLQAICYVILFSRLEINNSMVSKISPFVFGSYLLQDNSIFRRIIITDKMVFINKLNVVVGVIVVIALSCLFLVVGVLVEKLRIALFRLLKIDTLIDSVSKIVIEKYDFLVEKARI